jgi:hypothetical protein
MIDLIDEQIRESDAFKNVQEGVDTNLEGILQNALNNAVDAHWVNMLRKVRTLQHCNWSSPV